MSVTRLDLGHMTIVEAEHWLAAQPPVPGRIACTHLVHGSGVVVSLGMWPESAEGGRAVIFPGADLLRGVMSVARLLEVSAIERIHMLGGPLASPAEEIDTRDFVRPQWMDGQLTLVCTPAPHGRIAPFEVPNPMPCCADH
jgi:hypothetical protein